MSHANDYEVVKNINTVSPADECDPWEEDEETKKFDSKSKLIEG
jgi:hypothetical protein